jgi:hypothetical protein
MIAQAAVEQGLISDKTVQELDKSEADALIPHASVLYGTNARSNARRAAEYLGWTPREESLVAEIPKAVARERKNIKN